MKKTFLFTLIILFATVKANAQTVDYEVYALKYASVGFTFPVSYLVLGAPAKDSMNAIFMVWLIKGNNGKNIIVDAGF